MSNQGEILKNLIRGAGLSQQQAADKMGITRQTLFSYTHRNQLTLDILQNVKERLGLELTNPSDPSISEPINDHMDRLIKALEKQIELLEDSIRQRDKIIELYEKRNAIDGSLPRSKKMGA